MKILIIFVALFLAQSAPARDLTFAWDPNPESDIAGYRFFKKNKTNGQWEKIGETAETTLRFADFPDTPETVMVTAFNDAGLESLPSNELAVPTTPVAPTGLSVKITITVEVNP